MPIFPADLDWEDKFEALNALAECKIFPLAISPVREDRFGASLKGIEIKNNGMLESAVGFGLHVYSAVEKLWDICVTDLRPDQYLVKDSFSDTKRRHFRWNGFMWKEE